jgi:hypothetical protein
MASATISHWGAEMLAEPDWLLEEPALSLLNPHLAEAFTEIEKYDLLVKGAVLLQDSPTELSLTCYSDLDVGKPENTDSDAPVQVMRRIPCCPECSMPQTNGKLHPENGCPYAIVDRVMST